MNLADHAAAIAANIAAGRAWWNDGGAPTEEDYADTYQDPYSAQYSAAQREKYAKNNRYIRLHQPIQATVSELHEVYGRQRASLRITTSATLVLVHVQDRDGNYPVIQGNAVPVAIDTPDGPVQEQASSALTRFRGEPDRPTVDDLLGYENPVTTGDGPSVAEPHVVSTGLEEDGSGRVCWYRVRSDGRTVAYARERQSSAPGARWIASEWDGDPRNDDNARHCGHLVVEASWPTLAAALAEWQSGHGPYEQETW